MPEDRDSQRAPSVGLCAGKSCRKSQGFSQLEAALSESCALRKTACLGVCKGPVVVIRQGDEEPEVLKRLRKKKHRRDLLELLSGAAEWTERLQRRRLSGRKRVKALAKVERGKWGKAMSRRRP